jgi:histidinol-phosphate aminotransferase
VGTGATGSGATGSGGTGGGSTRADCYRPAVAGLVKYVAGTTTEQVQRELGLTDIVKLASNENVYGPSPAALRAIVAEMPNLWQYPEQSFFDLKNSLAEANGVTSENIVVGHGTEAIIQLIPQLFVNPGDEVVCADIGFGRHDEASKLMEARLVVVPLRGFRYDLEAVAAAVTARTKLIWLCSPNNPTGTIVRRQETHRLLESLDERVTVVFDQAYAEFVDDPEYADGLAFFKEGFRNIVVLRTFSKAYGLAGLRLGYAIVNEDDCWQLDTIKEPFNVNRLSIVAGSAALTDTEWLADCLARIRAGRAFLTAALEGLGFDVVPSQANFVLVDVHEDGEALWRRLLGHGVIVRPAAGWGLPTCLRVTVGTPEQNERFLEALRLETQRA